MMVNHLRSDPLRGRLLTELRQARSPLSGDWLGDRLGVSRVAVWKQIRFLEGRGYRFAATPRGYRLLESPDRLYPYEFPGREGSIHHLEATASTMGIARRLARRGCPHFTLVIAESQSAGRGRLLRTWRSAPGGIYATLVLRPPIPLVECGRVNFAVAVSVCETIEGRCGLPARVKWPNDVLIEGRKVAGLLLEVEASGELVAHLNVGMGLNVNNDPTAEEPGAVSLRLLLGRPVPRRELLAELLDRIEERVAPQRLEEVVAAWRALSVTLGREVRVVTGTQTITGTARDVDEQGALILAAADGSTRRIFHGDCFDGSF
jgi:BirA family biotin operon repressor/biotin-[acetyl-CoA-carboxylase] ligase